MAYDFELAIHDKSSNNEVLDWNYKLTEFVADTTFVTPAGEKPLQSKWLHLDFGNINFNFFKNVQAFRVEHKKSLEKHGANNCYELIIANTPLELTHYNHQLTVPPNHFVFLDRREDYSFDVLHENSFGISIYFDPQWLIQWVANPKLSVCHPFRSDKGWGKVLYSVIEAIYNAESPDLTFPRGLITDQLGSLLSLIVLPETSKLLSTRHQVSLYSRLERVLLDNYQLPELNADDVAAKAGVSKRHLFNVFNKASTTFSNELMKIRLEKSRAMLKDEKYNAFRVCDIAWACGFSDSSHFTRRFKERYSSTPTVYRKRKFSNRES